MLASSAHVYETLIAFKNPVSEKRRRTFRTQGERLSASVSEGHCVGMHDCYGDAP